MRRLRLLGAAGSVVLIAVALVLALVGGDHGDPVPRETAPRLVDADDLLELEGSLGHPIYWAGERPGLHIELREEDGNAYLRYLPPGVEVGDPRQSFLTVGTYPVEQARAAIVETAAEAGATVGRVAAGGLVLANPASPGSVYLAYPDTDLQIEVYDPRPGRALQLIRSGAIRPVGEPQ